MQPEMAQMDSKAAVPPVAWVTHRARAEQEISTGEPLHSECLHGALFHHRSVESSDTVKDCHMCAGLQTNFQPAATDHEAAMHG
jgi:hypothetical protein